MVHCAAQCEYKIHLYKNCKYLSFYCVQCRKKALLIRIGVEIVWDNVNQ